MKPMNFPERKRQRQIRALDRLVRTQRYEDGLADREYKALTERTKVNLRDVRTKKNRS